MEEKKSNVKSAIIVLLIGVVIGLLLFICYDKFYSKNTGSNSNSSNNPSTITKSISADSDIVKTAMKKFDGIRIYDKELYEFAGYNISNISKENIILTAIDHIDTKYISPCDLSYKAQVASIEYLNTLLKNYILDKEITIDDIKTIKNMPGYDFIKVKENGITVDGICGDEWYANDYVEKKIISAEEKDDYLYVYEKAAFARYLSDDFNSNVDYYKDYGRTDAVEKNMKSLELYSPEDRTSIQGPNWDLYNTYKYTFKKINDSYYFQTFELKK